MLNKILLLILFSSLFINAEEEWREFSYRYTSADYTLRNDIEYFEMRTYLFKNDELLSNKYYISFQIGSKKFTDYSRKIISKFQSVSFNHASHSIISSSGVDHRVHWLRKHSFMSQGFIIKKHKETWIITEPKDFFWLFDKLDSEAELAYIMRTMKMVDIHDKVQFRSTKDGYELKVKVFKYPTFDGKIHYIPKPVYLYTIDRKGNFTKKLVEDNREILLEEPIHPDPPWAFGIGVPKQPNNIEEWIYEKYNFITPMKEFYIF